MGEYTPNLNLYKPKATQPVEKGWGALVNESIDVIDTELNAAAKSVFLVGDVVNYVSNAVYTGGKWNRRNTGLGATRVAFDPSARTITVYYVNAGANPISWVKMETFTTAGFDMGGKKVANMATPSVASDAATKGYIDGLIAALKLSQIAIDGDKDWKGKSITNLNALQAGTVNGIIPIPPPTSHLVEVPEVLITPTVIVSRPGPYPRPGNTSGSWYTLLEFSIPSNLSSYGISAPYGLIKITFEYSMYTATDSASTRVLIDGNTCDVLTLVNPRYSNTFTATKTLYVKSGANFKLQSMNGSNASPDPSISNVSVTLEGSYPFGDITASQYPTVTKMSGAMLTPYSYAHLQSECTCNFDGMTATMTDRAARSFFPQQPGKITLGWKSGNSWATSRPNLKFYRGRI